MLAQYLAHYDSNTNELNIPANRTLCDDHILNAYFLENHYWFDTFSNSLSITNEKTKYELNMDLSKNEMGIRIETITLWSKNGTQNDESLNHIMDSKFNKLQPSPFLNLSLDENGNFENTEVKDYLEDAMPKVYDSIVAATENFTFNI